MAVESPGEDNLRMDMGAMAAAVWSRRLRILLVTALLLVGTYGVLQFIPKMYESVASILVEPRANAYTRANNEVQPSAGIADETTISSQIELIKSRDTLLRVIESEKLGDVPELAGSAASPVDGLFALLGRKPDPKASQEAVLQSLNERLTVIRERDSRIISIYARSEDPQLAARIANALAAAHVERRAELSLSDTAEASVWLEQQIDSLRQRVAEAENKVASFRIDNDLFNGANNTSLLDQQL